MYLNRALFIVQLLQKDLAVHLHAGGIGQCATFALLRGSRMRLGAAASLLLCSPLRSCHRPTLRLLLLSALRCEGRCRMTKTLAARGAAVACWQACLVLAERHASEVRQLAQAAGQIRAGSGHRDL